MCELHDPVTRSRTGKGEAQHDTSKGRICNSCHVYKSRAEFYKHPSGFNGLGSRCKTCFQIAGPSQSEQKKAHYTAARCAGRCVRCGQVATANIFCVSCWFKDKARQRADGATDAVVALWHAQDGKCFYTGEILYPGENASLDHQDPVSKGGSNDISNLRWVLKQVNLMKTDMTHAEFVERCEHISIRFSV